MTKKANMVLPFWLEWVRTGVVPPRAPWEGGSRLGRGDARTWLLTCRYAETTGSRVRRPIAWSRKNCGRRGFEANLLPIVLRPTGRRSRWVKSSDLESG